MDEIPIVSSNTIKPLASTSSGADNKKQAKGKARKRVVSFKENLINWFYMLPIFLIAAVQLYFLGKSFGAQTTLPPTSFSSLIYLGILISILVFLQMQMRSMLFAMGTSTALLMGIYSAWFGDFLPLTLSNLSNIGAIMQLSWSKKNLPFDLIVTSGISLSIVLLAGIQFFLALIVKSFFEVFFGKEWGNGRLYGYIGACVLLLVAQFSIMGYRAMASETSSRLKWKVELVHSPLEKFLMRTPSDYQVSKDRLVFTSDKQLYDIELESGLVRQLPGLEPFVVHKGFKGVQDFLMFGQTGLFGYSAIETTYEQKVAYPKDQRNLEGAEGDEEAEKLDITLPLTSYGIAKGRLTLVSYDYGHYGMYDNKTGRELWFRQLDLGIEANRNFPETYLEEGFFYDGGRRLILSCHNGVIRCIETLTGKDIWTYTHSTQKINGNSVKGLLSGHEDRLIVAFRTGEILTFDVTDGRQLYKASNPLFVAQSPVKASVYEAEFFDKNGIYYRIKLDGGVILESYNSLEVRSELAPVISSLEGPVVINGGKIYWLDRDGQRFKEMFALKNRSFITEPVFEDKIMYVGTLEGWVYCLHRESGHVKWVVKADGELQTDSLFLLEKSLLVKTKSGSVYCFNREFGN
jgi:outer membrane protein assembly factor BamB